jgi:hypothetical protein
LPDKGLQNLRYAEDEEGSIKAQKDGRGELGMEQDVAGLSARGKVPLKWTLQKQKWKMWSEFMSSATKKKAKETLASGTN